MWLSKCVLFLGMKQSWTLRMISRRTRMTKCSISWKTTRKQSKIKKKRKKRKTSSTLSECSREMLTSSLEDASSAPLTLLPSLIRCLRSGSARSNLSRDLRKNTTNKSKNLIEKFDCLKMTLRWENKKKHKRSQSYNLKKSLSLISLSTRRLIHQSTIRNTAKIKKPAIFQC